MFKVNLRIVLDDEDMSDLREINIETFNREYGFITGFFQICMGKYCEGSYYHENPIAHWEVGPQLLESWLGPLLYIVKNIHKETYIAFHEMDSDRRWLEFKLYDYDNVLISVAQEIKFFKNDLPYGFPGLVTEPIVEFEYKKPFQYEVSFSLISEEIIKAGNKFLRELYEINPLLMGTDMVIKLDQFGLLDIPYPQQ